MSEPAAPMRVSYIFSFADYQAFGNAAATGPEVCNHNKKWNCITNCSIFGAMFLILMALSLTLRRDRASLFSPLSALVDAGLWFVVANVVVILRRKPISKSLFASTRVYDGQASHVLAEAGAASGTFGWSDITRSAMMNEYFFLFVAPTEGLVFPRRAFMSAAEFDAAFTYAKERIHGQTL